MTCCEYSARSAAFHAAIRVQQAIRQRIRQRRRRAAARREWDVVDLLDRILAHDFDDLCCGCGSLEAFPGPDGVPRCLSCGLRAGIERAKEVRHVDGA